MNGLGCVSERSREIWRLAINWRVLIIPKRSFVSNSRIDMDGRVEQSLNKSLSKVDGHFSLFWNFIFDFKTVYFHTIFIFLTVHFDAKWSSSESNIEWKNQWTWNSFYWGRNKKIFIKFPNFSFFFARSTKEILHWFHQFNIF